MEYLSTNVSGRGLLSRRGRYAYPWLGLYALLFLTVLFYLPGGSLAHPAQDKPAAETKKQSDRESNNTKTYTVNNGTSSYARVEESEHKKTADGEVEIQRVRMPSYGGDEGVLFEKEIRTKTLPDGTIEKETILKNPDGSKQMVPTEVIHETIKKHGDSTEVESETDRPDLEGRWNPVSREHRSETNGKSVQQTETPTATGDWKVVERQETLTKASKDGEEVRSVKQIPDAYGRMSDYEVREEKVSKQGGKESREVLLRRRDFSDSDQSKFYVVERTVSDQTTTADGKVVVNTRKESDLSSGGASRNIASHEPEVVEEKSEVVSTEGGTVRKVVTVKERTVGDPSLHSSYQVVQETDPQGYVRQVFVPSQ